MEVSHNHNAKSQLAKLLATENITVQHKPDAKTAWFDVKSRVLSLPVWREMSDDLYDLLVVHEVGHALDTPAEGWLDAIQDIAKRIAGSTSTRAIGAVKGFLNVIEDARIDKRQKRRFPGARRNYVKGYKELIDKDFFGTATRDVNTMEFIDRLNIYCKGGSMLGIKFNAEEKAWLAKVEAAETFDEVLTLTEEIYAWSKRKMDEREDESDETDMRQKSGGEGEDEDFSDFGDDEDFDDEDNMSSGSSYADEDEEESDEDTDETDSGEPDDGAGSDGDIMDGANRDEPLPESETEKAWQKSQSDLVLNSNEEYVYVKIPRPTNYDKMVVDYKTVLAEQRAEMSGRSGDWLTAVRAELQKFKADEKNTISYMVKEFEMRKSADEYARTSVSKTGVIDTNKLHSYKYNDDLFRRITTVATGKNHGFVMFLDWSGSMHSNLKKTLKQLFSLVMFCKQVQIPFEVYTFRSVSYHDNVDGTDFWTKNMHELDLRSFFARNILSSRMNTQELNEAMFNLYSIGCGGHMRCEDLNSTPLNDCIAMADLVVNRFKAKSKVQIVNTIFLTDGDSDGINSINGLGYSHKNRKYILQDDITKKTYDIRADNDYHARRYPYATAAMTTLLLRVLKDRTGCNLLGFYICGDGFEGSYRKFNGYGGKTEDHEVSKKSWTAEGFYSTTAAGYDEYYIINPRLFNVSTNNLNVDSSMTKRKMASEFIKFSEKKAVSRVLLNRFVKRIAA